MTAYEKALRQACAARLAAIGAGQSWTPPQDLALIRAVLADTEHWEAAVSAIDHTPRSCLARLRRLLPPVLSADVRAALLAELEARANHEDAQP